MTEPLVSVIVPCYNYGRFLSSAIESLLNQTYNNFEVVIVDDCSTDNTPEVATSYSNKYQNIKYIRQTTNVGQSENRNVGLRAAKGKYVAFLDADDAYDPTKLEKQVNALNSSDCGVTYCCSKLCDEHLTPLNFQCADENVKSGWVAKQLFIGNFVQGMTLMVKKDLIDLIGGFLDEKRLCGLGVDWWLLLQLATLTKFQASSEQLYLYRHHSTQMSNDVVRRIKSDLIIRTMFLDTYPNLIDKQTLRMAKKQSHLQAGFYYRKAGDKLRALHNHIKYILLSPLTLIGYKSIVVTLIGKADNKRGH